MNDKEGEAIIAALEGLTLGGAVRRSARLFPRQEFLKSDGRSLDFGEFDLAVDGLASGFLGLGIARGDKIAVWLENSIEWVMTLCAAARIGAVLVPINTRYKPAEAGYLLAQSDARALVMKRHIWDNDYLEMLQQIAPSLARQSEGPLELDELPELRHLVMVGEETVPASVGFSRLAASDVAPALAAAEAAVQPADPMLIVYTSGTTGKPKGAMHNHIVIKQATRVGLACRLEPGGRVLGHMPLYHVAGLYMGLLPALALGACFVVMPQWDTARALELLERERITLFGGIPTHFVDLANHPSLPSRDLSSLEIAWIGGSAVMQATFEQFMQVLGLKYLLSTYGMTENTISTTFNRIEDPIDACCENRARVLARCEVRVVDQLTGKNRAVGESGEVWCRGETVMMGYYKNPEATREAITDDGWLKTGDLGHFDAGGYLSITGRVKEMYKTGGTNVYPAEIEQHLIRHPAVKIAAVVGVPDERLGEVGFAFVQAHERAPFDLATLRAHCKAELASYKIPRHLLVVPELPRTTTGKIQRTALLDLARAELARNPATEKS